MLSGIRKAYLDVNSRPGQSSQTPLIHITLDGENRDWVVPQRLTNEERDMLDRQAKDILSLCSKRVKEMEALEKRAQKSVPCRLALTLELMQVVLSSSENRRKAFCAFSPQCYAKTLRLRTC